MCGISGVYIFSEKGADALSKIKLANQTLSLRGPDGGDVYINQRTALGHRRLSIIDVSCNGDQPMHSTDGRYTIIFNGEIFNYRELRDQYLTLDEKVAMRSHSDTEVFLQLFTRLKEGVFPLLHGFFAAGIYDHQTEELVLVRDRYGKKPLLFYQDGEKLLFASEMKALFAAGIPKEINWDLLPVYFQLNYVPQPYSLVKGVRKLAPGNYLKITRSGSEEKAYYELRVQPEQYRAVGYDDAKKQLVALMDKAVQMRLISDVPLGAF
jgi:asparagine synthase (glutamine-hydrolysing)